jgi:hypothetical protein
MRVKIWTLGSVAAIAIAAGGMTAATARTNDAAADQQTRLLNEGQLQHPGQLEAQNDETPMMGSAEMRNTARTSGTNPDSSATDENHPGSEQAPYPGMPATNSGCPNPDAAAGTQNHPGTDQPPYPGTHPGGTVQCTPSQTPPP